MGYGYAWLYLLYRFEMQMSVGKYSYYYDNIKTLENGLWYGTLDMNILKQV